MMTSKTLLVSFFALGCFSVVGAGCAATTEPTEPTAAEEAIPDESIESTRAALLAGGGGGGLGFSCSRLGCICHGDFDCNNMFDGNACGSWPSKCYERGPGPVYCICAPWVKHTVASGGGVVTGGTSGVLLR